MTDDPGHAEAGFNPDDFVEIDRPIERPVSSPTAIWLEYRLNSLQRQIDASNRLIEQLTGGGELWCSVCLYQDEDDRPVGWAEAPLTIINGALLCEDHARYSPAANVPLSRARLDLHEAQAREDLKASQALVEQARRGQSNEELGLP